MSGPLTAGEPLTPQQADSRRRKSRPPTPTPPRPRRGRLRRLLRGVLGGLLGMVVLAAVLGGAGGYFAWLRFSADLPDVDGLRNYQPPVMSRVYAGDARLIAELATERRIFVPSSAIPEVVKQAFVSAEDQNFWTHPGVDPLAIVRAAVFDLAHMGEGRRPVGASTITQQVAKNMLLDNEVSLARKAREAILAMRIEQALSKDRILELYLNEIYLGLQFLRRGGGGAGLFQQAAGPADAVGGRLPGGAAEGAEQLQSVPLPGRGQGRGATGCWTGMAEDRAITAAQAAAAKAEPIIPSEFRRPQPVPGADWFAEEVRRELIEPLRRRCDHPGRPDGAHQSGPRIAARRGKGGARRADGAMTASMGGWRGPVSHLDGGAGAGNGTGRGSCRRWRVPPGMLSDWKLAVVLDASDSEARLAWLEPAGQAASQQHIGTLPLSDLAWARPVKDGKPRRRRRDA